MLSIQFMILYVCNFGGAWLGGSASVLDVQSASPHSQMKKTLIKMLRGVQRVAWLGIGFGLEGLGFRRRSVGGPGFRSGRSRGQEEPGLGSRTHGTEGLGPGIRGNPEERPGSREPWTWGGTGVLVYRLGGGMWLGQY